MSASPSADCVFLEWDSNFFGVRIGRLRNRRLNPEVVRQALAWMDEHSIDCLYFLADPDDAETVHLAESNGFHQTDVRITFERSLAGFDTRVVARARTAREDDLPILRALAAQSHRDGRFYFDSNLSGSLCDKFYATWLENSFRGFAKTVLVAEDGSGPTGYITCDLHGQESQIGIIAVAERARGAGVGKLLVHSFLDWSGQVAAQRAIVVTQGRNVVAQRLYQSCGFRTRSLELWYHRWSPKSAAGRA